MTLLAASLSALSLSARAETINLYGWQNHSWEFVDIDGGRSFDRIQSNAGNIGFSASVDTGMSDIKVNLQCEQFTYYNHFAGGTGWCNRNSKIGLAHPMAGEIMFATWLLPYNEGVAQWVDPFYDAGADSHTSIMGSVGANTIFYNTGDFDQQASASGPATGFSGAEFNYAGAGYDTGFNRRQENIIQYWSPNWNGFVFRFAWTAGNRDETMAPTGGGKIDPVIRSSSLAYTNGPLWLAATWQDHEDWTAVSVGEMESSDAESFRLAGRYIMDLGDGMSVQLSAMWETLEYEFHGVTTVEKAMAAFGYGNFASSYAEPIYAMDAATKKVDETVMDPTQAEIDAQMTRGLAIQLLTDDRGHEIRDNNANNYIATALGQTIVTTAAPNKPAEWTFGEIDPSVALPTTTVIGEYRQYLSTVVSKNAHQTSALIYTVDPVKHRQSQPFWTTRLTSTELTVLKLGLATSAIASSGATQKVFGDPALYTAIMNAAKKNAKTKKQMDKEAEMKKVEDARMAKSMGSNVKIERDAWMVSGKIKFGGPLDFRFSYMDADDLELSCNYCMGDWDETAADAWNVGVFYTMPAGTELRLTYSEVNNDDNGTYGQGISGTGLGTAGAEIEMFALGIVHWFD